MSSAVLGAGFVDFSRLFKPTTAAWAAIGIAIGVGTVVSTLLQTRLLIQKRSNVGLNCWYMAMTSIAQFVLVVNVLCMRSTDIIGICQFPLSETFTTYITFINTFALWICYLPTIYLNYVFGCNKSLVLPAVACLITVVDSAILLGFLVTGSRLGFGSKQMLGFGKGLGTFASVLCYFQYAPQFVTTYRLKGSGSLSLVMLAIQAPGGLVNVLFMLLGQGHHWSTWFSGLVAAMQQLCLLGLCLFYKCRKQHEITTTDTLPIELDEALV